MHTTHTPWRQVALIVVALPTIVTLAVLVFAWPSARIAPRDLPVGIVGTGSVAQQAAEQLTRDQPGAFDLRLYADVPAARAAIENRDVYGAFAVTPTRVTLLEAGAASPTVAQLLTGVGQGLGAAASVPVRTVDVVPPAPADPRGAVFASALLPLIICGMLIAAVVAAVARVRPAWRQIVCSVVVSAVAGAGAYLVAQGFLGALPHDGILTWAALSLSLLAFVATASGFAGLLGPSGLGVAGLLLVFLGNPFSGITSAPELLPGPVHRIGQLLPPGAAAGLVRSTAYFDGHGAGAHLTVLLVWTVLGLAGVVQGHRRAAVATEPAPDGAAPTPRPTPTPRHLVGVGLHETG